MNLSDKATESSRACPVCREVSFKRLRNCKDKANPFWRKCKNCSTVYARMIPSAEELREYYKDYYNSESPTVPPFIGRKLSEVFSSLNSHRSELNSILDIGFGAGTFLDVAAKEGWTCSGSEYSPDSIKDGLTKGWTVHMGDLMPGDLNGPFDVVSAIEVLEHVSLPQTIIEKASFRLRKDGAFYGTTPNGGSLNLKILGEKWSVLSYPEHQVLLNPNSLMTIMGQNSMVRLQLRTKGFNPSDIINYVRASQIRNKTSKQSSTDRVALGYSINSILEGNFALRVVKLMTNFVLSLLKSGDSIEFLVKKH
jgi:2-polyprenyl-3-methyl-5-hydroxy-6-metoxy-1,4-benzoquinol methylase